MRSYQIGDDNYLTREGEQVRKEEEYLKKEKKALHLISYPVCGPG